MQNTVSTLIEFCCSLTSVSHWSYQFLCNRPTWFLSISNTERVA